MPLRPHTDMLHIPVMTDTPPIKRLAVIYPKAIGDFLFLLPALHSIRKAFPDTHITLVVKSKQAPLAVPQKNVLADEILVLGGRSSWRDVRRRLSEQKADTVVDMAGNDQAGLILTWRGGRRIRPRLRDGKGLCALYSPFAETFPRLPAGRHRVEELLCFAEHLGATERVYSFRMKLPDQAVEESEKVIAAHDLHSGTVIALNLGASRDTKRWPAEHFRELARLLVAAGHRVVLMGARAFKADGHYDRGVIERFIQDGVVNHETCINLVTNHDLPPGLQLQRDAHFLRYSNVPRVTVGNDTGPMHMAGSIGDDARNKTVSLFGPTNWGRYAPYDASRRFPDTPRGDWNHVLSFNPGCGPVHFQEACRCYRRGCAHKTCMVTLTPESVFEAVTAMITAS